MSWTLKELADLAGGRATNQASAIVEGFRGIEEAGKGDLTFVTSGRWLDKLNDEAAAVIPPDLEKVAGDRPLIVADNARLAFARILEAVKPDERPPAGVDSRAAVMEGAVLGEGIHVGPLAYVGHSAKVGDRSILYASAHVAENSCVGADCVLFPHSYIGPGSRLGDRVVLGPGASIGHDGFAYQWDGSRHVKVPQVGIAVIEDDVEIGAMAAVDRAMLGETRIGKGTKIDNLVMVGHNCRIGQNVILVAQVGLSGRVPIEDGVVLAGQVGVREGTRIGAGVVAVGQSGIAKDVPPGMKIGGTPARRETVWLRGQAAADKLPDMLRKIKRLEERVKELEERK